MPVPMPYTVFRWFVPAQNGTGLVPAAGYKAKFYSAGTDIAKTIYEWDDTPYASPANEAELNAEGYAEIKLGPGNYKLVVTDPDDAEVFTQDNINGDGTFGTGFCETVIATDDPPTNGLAQVDTANRFTWCGGYWAIGDGGHGFFWNEESEEPDDGGYVIASDVDPTIKWFREPDEGGKVRAASFGYVGTRDEDLTDELLAASGYCQANDKTLLIGPGSTATFGASGQTYNFYHLAGGTEFEPGAVITGNAGVTLLRLWGEIKGPDAEIFVDIPVEIMTSQVLDKPEWFGASRSSADNTAALNDWFACFGSESPAGVAFVLPPGEWTVTGSVTFPEAPVILYGTIVEGEVSYHGIYFPGTDSVFKFNTWEMPNGATLAPSGADDGEFTGRLLTAGLTASDTVLSDSDVVAGNGGTEGYLYGSIGQSGTSHKAGGAIRASYQDLSTTSTTLTDLISINLIDDTLVASSDRLTIRTGGTIGDTGSGTGMRYTITLGGQTLFDKTIDYNQSGGGSVTGNWVLTVDVRRNGGDFEAIGGLVSHLSRSGEYLNGCAADYRTGTVDWGTGLIVQVQGQDIAGTGVITNRTLTVDYLPYPP